MDNGIVVANEPEEITELVNPQTGQTVIYHPKGFQSGWREKYPEEIERLLNLDLLDDLNSVGSREEKTRYPFIKEVGFSRFNIEKLSETQRESYNQEYSRWAFEVQVSEVIKHFLRFMGECPICKKFWNSGTTTKITCFCGTTIELVDEGGVKLEFDEVYQKRQVEFAARHADGNGQDDRVEPDEPEDLED